MFSFTAKILLLLAPLFFSCSREGTPPLWEPQTELDSREYKGGLFPVWITLKEPAREGEVKIEWNEGKAANIVYRKQGIDSVTNLIMADTAYFHWETLPPPFIKIDSIETTAAKDSVKSWKLDTTYFYIDTIYAIVDGVESEPIAIEVKNILPRIKSISVGGVSQPGDALLTIAANPGVKLEISISFEKAFNQSNRARVEMPKEKMKGNLEDPKFISDTLWIYDWTPPSEPVADSSMYIKIKDSGGSGERQYKVYLVVYNEIGSIWVAAEKELVKYTSMGVEVARIGGFGYISDIAVNSNNGRLFVADRDSNAVNIYNNYGKNLSKNVLFDNPTGVAIEVVGEYAWVADAQGLQRFKITNDTLNLEPSVYSMKGTIKGLSVNQFRTDFAWFADTENDRVGFVKNQTVEYIDNISWSRPEMVSDYKGVAWIADNARVIAINESGKVMAKISGFNFVSSVSADGGGVWVSDIDARKVYRFKGPFNGNEIDTTLTITNGIPLGGIGGFSAPAFVSALVSDGSAWVVDKQAGMIVLCDTLGNKVAYGTGLNQAYLGKTIQIVE